MQSPSSMRKNENSLIVKSHVVRKRFISAVDRWTDTIEYIALNLSNSMRDVSYVTETPKRFISASAVR